MYRGSAIKHLQTRKRPIPKTFSWLMYSVLLIAIFTALISLLITRYVLQNGKHVSDIKSTPSAPKKVHLVSSSPTEDLVTLVTEEPQDLGLDVVPDEEIKNVKIIQKLQSTTSQSPRVTTKKMLSTPFFPGVTLRNCWEDLSVYEEKRTTNSPPANEAFHPAESLNKEQTSSFVSSPTCAKQPHNDSDKLGLITLEEIVAYECYHEASIKQFHWVNGSDIEVYFLDTAGQKWIINLIQNSTVPEKVSPGPEVFERPQQHVSTVWRCTDELCRFTVRHLSSVVETKPLKFGDSVVSEISKLAHGKPADFTYLHELSGGMHKRKFSVWIDPRDSNFNEYTNSCTRSLMKEYEFVWNKYYLTPKYTVLVTEACPSHQLARKDEFAFDGVQNFDFSPAVTKQRPVKAATVSVRTDGNSFTGVGDSNTGLRNRAFGNNSTLISTGGTWRNREEKGRKRRSLDENDSFEYLGIGNTNWVLHTAIRSSKSRPSVLSLAVSQRSILDRDIKIHEPGWIPLADGRAYRAILGDDLYVTRILGMRMNANSCLVFFMAAPVFEFFNRFLYQMLMAYSVDQVAFVSVECLTCVEDDNGLNVVGQRPQCAWSEVRMSPTAKNYILDCKGQETPWSSVVSTQSNEIIYQLNTDKRSNFTTHHYKMDFEVDLKGSFRTRARLYLPKKCNKAKLLLNLGDKQMVTAKYKVSIVDYLTSVKGYAVLHADVRGSRFLNLDVAKVRFRRRQKIQVRDYIKVAEEAVKLAQGCIDPSCGYGVFGESYSGQIALGLLANSDFHCALAIRPFIPWQSYARTPESSDSIAASERKRRNLMNMMRRARGKKFALFDVEPEPDAARRQHVSELLEFANRLEIRNYTHKSFNNTDDCIWRLKLYRELSDYFDKCFDGT